MEFYKLEHEAVMKDIMSFKHYNQKLAVIAHVEDVDGKILLQQRGIKSRDENGLYEDIGGKLETYDASFRTAIIREIQEEAGEEINLTIGNTVGIYHVLKKGINWIFIVFDCTYYDGKIKVLEPDKCRGYKFFTYDELLTSEVVTESCKYLTKCLKKKRKS